MEMMDFLNGATQSLFRWERLQHYAGDEARMVRFKKSGEIDMNGMCAWWKFLSNKRNEGVVLQRVRLVTEPMTDYTKWELVIHKESGKHGDDIRIINEEQYKQIEIDHPDFWLIDNKTVLLLIYDAEGKYIGFEISFATPNHIAFKEALLQRSESL